MAGQLIREPLGIDTTLLRFQWKIEEKYGKKFGNYWDFHQWSVDNYPAFWEEVWNFFKIVHSEPYTEVLEPNKKFEEVPKWFLGAQLNYAENLLNQPSGNVALIITGEQKPIPKLITYGELREEVALLSSALRNVGVKKGDVVACFISNRKEAITSMLAAASIGALYTSTNPLMGIQAVVDRFRQVSPKVLFTVDRYMYDRKEKNVLSLLPDLVKALKTLQYVVIAPSMEESTKKDISFIPKSIFLPEFLKLGLLPNGKIPAPKYESLPFSHPFFIMYTSGTTGVPKGIVHSTGAALLMPIKDLGLHFNIKSSDVVMTIFSTGWVTFNCFVATLALGGTLVIYEGLLFYQSPTAFYDIVDKHGVTLAMITPNILEDMEKRQMLPGPHNSLSTLHTIISGSCHVKGHTFEFVQNKIKPDVFFSTIFGSTEFLSMFSGINHNMPVHKEELQIISLGIDLCCYNNNGERVLDQVGELIVAKPFPSMPLHFWNDNEKKRYRQCFFETFPGVWCHGDRCIINSKTRGLIVKGRSDETIKQRGARFGSAEIYNIVNKMKEVSDSVCVSRINKEGTEIAYLFLKMNQGFSFTVDFWCSVQKNIAKELTRQHIPETILPVKDIPYNLNGKRMEVLVKKILSGVKNFSRDSMSNPECLLEYLNFSECLSNYGI